MLNVLGHQGRSPGRADSKQHKTEQSDLQRLHLGKTIGEHKANSWLGLSVPRCSGARTQIRTGSHREVLGAPRPWAQLPDTGSSVRPTLIETGQHRRGASAQPRSRGFGRPQQRRPCPGNKRSRTVVLAPPRVPVSRSAELVRTRARAQSSGAFVVESHRIGSRSA